jgi:hypothetical protein
MRWWDTGRTFEAASAGAAVRVKDKRDGSDRKDVVFGGCQACGPARRSKFIVEFADAAFSARIAAR